jgi:NTP pyrophosphatase (non-canonical NTP hydrolase)
MCAIECYRDECEYHEKVEPFCNQDECALSVTGVNSDNYSKLAVATEAPVTNEMKQRVITAIPYIDKIFEEQIMLGCRLDLLKKYIFYGKGVLNSIGDPAHHLQNRQNIMDEKVIRLIHCAIGLATETGELMEALKNHVYDNLPLDEANIGEELGDASWYVGIGSDSIGRSLTEILETNNAKLRHRYPEKFTEFHAENRDLKGERKILDTAITT